MSVSCGIACSLSLCLSLLPWSVCLSWPSLSAVLLDASFCSCCATRWRQCWERPHSSLLSLVLSSLASSFACALSCYPKCLCVCVCVSVCVCGLRWLVCWICAVGLLWLLPRRLLCWVGSHSCIAQCTLCCCTSPLHEFCCVLWSMRAVCVCEYGVWFVDCMQCCVPLLAAAVALLFVVLYCLWRSVSVRLLLLGRVGWLCLFVSFV